MPRKKYTDIEHNIMKKSAENLKKILLEKRITQKELSEITGLATSTISDYMNGYTLISLGNLQIISNALKINKSEIDSSLLLSDKIGEKTINLPIYDKISCGNGYFESEGIIGYEETPKSWVSGENHFYIKAKGNSMIGARIFDGDLLLIKKQPDVEDGDIVAILMENKAVMKRIFFRNDNIILQSENPNYSPIIVSKDNIEIIGKLKKIIVNI